jgi:hypothetical protein
MVGDGARVGAVAGAARVGAVIGPLVGWVGLATGVGKTTVGGAPLGELADDGTTPANNSSAKTATIKTNANLIRFIFPPFMSTLGADRTNQDSV